MRPIKLKRDLTLKIGGFKSNSTGFVFVSFVTLVPLLLIGIFSFSSVMQLNNIKTNLESSCLSTQNQSFHRQRQRLIKLLSLNPEATRLSLTKTTLKIQMAAAVASGQFELLAALEIKYEKIIVQQEKLALKQKQLLAQSKEEFIRRELFLLKNLSEIQNKLIHRSQSLWNLRFDQIHPGNPHLAVEPSSSDIAPTYKLENNFESNQTWRVRWTMQIASGLSMNSFLKFNYKVNQECATTLQQKGTNFLIIVPDKS